MGQNQTGAIRQAVASGEFPRAAALWNEYVAGLLQAISMGVCTQAQMEEACELLEWARNTVAESRTHMQDRLGALHAADQYSRVEAGSVALLRARM